MYSSCESQFFDLLKTPLAKPWEDVELTITSLLGKQEYHQWLDFNQHFYPPCQDSCRLTE